ncbi:MAG: DUF4012 domain-containing protein [bacterium]|nr:DUF4012 domain-containing protein [bacterium]
MTTFHNKKNTGRSWSWKRLYQDKRFRITAIALGVIIVLAFGLYLKYSGPAKRVMAHALNGKTHLTDAQTSVEAEFFGQAAEQLDSAHDELSLALDEMEGLGGLKAMPYVGTQLSAVDNLLRAGLQTSSALGRVAKLADEIITPVKNNGEFTINSLTPEQKHEMLKQVSEAFPDLVGIKAEIDLAVLHVDQIPEKGILPVIKNALGPVREQLPTLQQSIAQVLPAVEIMPTIVGYPEEQTYLFLLENNAEMRPTGGFIGTYGILKVKDGEITSFTTDNIYNLDNNVKDRLIEAPPAPMAKYLAADKWFMRDSNWSPDFPTSAEKAIWFYEQEGGTANPIHGVIAVTPTFIESLLGLTGEVVVDGITFTEENFYDTLQFQVEQGFYRQGISDSERKEVIGAMADILMDRLLNFPQSRWGELWQTVENHIDEKHILLYSRNESLQRNIELENWGAEVRDQDGDYVFVVDANMASLKSDPGVFRTIRYEVNETAEGLIADLRVEYNNTGSFDWKSTRLRTYTRVYVPLGSVLLNHEGVMENDKLHGGRSADPEVYEELGKTVIAGFISIEPQTTGTLHYQYRLPATVKNTDTYSLLVQKQAGTAPHQLEIALNFQDDILRAEPIDTIEQSADNSVALKTDLRSDKVVEITFE